MVTAALAMEEERAAAICLELKRRLPKETRISIATAGYTDFERRGPDLCLLRRNGGESITRNVIVVPNRRHYPEIG